MCSVDNGGDIEDLSTSVRLKTSSFRLPEKCNKCKDEKPQIILRNKDAYCKACFMTCTVHKFKALLGKHRLIKDNDRVLILHKGGHGTTALLHFLRTGLDMDTPKKLRFIPVSLFIVDQLHLKCELMSYLKKVVIEMKNFNIPIYFTSLSEYNQDGSLESLSLIDNLEKLTLSEGNPLITSKFETSESLVNDLRSISLRNLMIDAAKKLNCKFIFSPELSTDIASQLLSNVALGRGSHIPLDTGFCDTRDEVVTILKPLRVFDIKELALYNYFNHLDPVMIPEMPKNSHKSIQNLIENFVVDLQCNYPATVTTVLKTGDKLSVQKAKIKDIGALDGLNNIRKCYICKAPIETPIQQLTSQEAIKISHKISTSLPENDCNEYNIVTDHNAKTCFSCKKLQSLRFS